MTTAVIEVGAGIDVRGEACTEWSEILTPEDGFERAETRDQRPVVDGTVSA
jgi:hypothetical protein